MKFTNKVEIKVGRPSKYSPDFIKVAEDYLIACAKNDETPFIETLALKFSCDDSTLWNWQEAHEEFREVYRKITTYQKLDLKRKGLSGEYTSKIVYVLLSADHNVIEKQRQEVTGANGGAVEFKDTLTPEIRREY